MSLKYLDSRQAGKELLVDKTYVRRYIKYEVTPYGNAAANVGLIVDFDGYFRPDDRITREEMAVILCKVRAFMGLSETKGAIGNFSDRDQISGWAYAYVDVAASVGLIGGMPDGSFAPWEDTTRAQAASVIKRLLD